MSLNGIMANALSALQTNTTALDVVSSNISNINTPGYAQRVVNEEAQAVGGQLAGVDIADIERVTNQFLTDQTLSAQSSSSQYSAQNNILTQINALLGQVGSGTRSAVAARRCLYGARLRIAFADHVLESAGRPVRAQPIRFVGFRRSRRPSPMCRTRPISRL